MEMRNIGEALDSDHVLREKGLDLEQLEIHSNNNKLLLDIKQQLKDLNI